MTPTQQRVLEYIRDTIDSTGVCPTYEQVGRDMGLASKSGVHRTIAFLIEQGHLVRDGSAKQRNLRLPTTINLSAVPSSRLAAELARREIKR